MKVSRYKVHPFFVPSAFAVTVTAHGVFAGQLTAKEIVEEVVLGCFFTCFDILVFDVQIVARLCFFGGMADLIFATDTFERYFSIGIKGCTGCGRLGCLWDFSFDPERVFGCFGLGCLGFERGAGKFSMHCLFSNIYHNIIQNQ